MENLRIGIIGNIGVGKSTLVNAFKTPELSKMLLSVFPHLAGDEKIHTFQEEFDHIVLDAFYKNPAQHAFMAQVEFLNGRLRRQAKIERARGIVLEDRTIFEDFHVFGKAQKILGHMTEEEFRAYQRSYHLLTENFDQPDLVIYLRAKCVLPPCWTAIIAMVDSHYFPPLFNKFILPTVHHASSFGFCALTPH